MYELVIVSRTDILGGLLVRLNWSPCAFELHVHILCLLPLHKCFRMDVTCAIYPQWQFIAMNVLAYVIVGHSPRLSSRHNIMRRFSLTKIRGN